MNQTISLLSVLTFVLAFSGSAFAQAGSQNITASATIVSQLSFTTTNSLNFGKLSTSFSSVSIVPNSAGNGNVSKNNTGTGSQQGQVTIDSGSGTQAITVTINSPTTLDNGSSTLGFNPNYVGEDGTDMDANSGTNNVNTIDQSGSGTGPYDYTIYLGGSLDDPGSGNSDASGSLVTNNSYQGTITVNVDYQ